MKTAVNVLLAALALSAVPAKAELFSSSAAGGALLGGIAGAIIGNNSGHGNGAQGALIGAGAGLLLGAMADNNRPGRVYVHGSVGPRFHHGGHYQPCRPYGYYGYYQRPAVYISTPVYYAAPAPVYRTTYRQPSYAGTGLVVGGITGAIIGNNSGRHNTWRGAAIGAGAGLLIGAIADSAAREREVQVEQAPAYVPETQVRTQSSTTPQNVTIINNYYYTPSTPMSSVNGIYGR